MDKREHGRRLKSAMAGRRLDRTAIAEATGVKVRTVTNWTSGATMPSEAEKAIIRELLGEYDAAGDEVELAVRASELHEWRQDAVLSFYKRNLFEQRAEEPVSEGRPNLRSVAKTGVVEPEEGDLSP